MENSDHPKMFSKTQDLEKVDSAWADAEWKADPGLGDIVHGVEGTVSISFHLPRHVLLIVRRVHFKGLLGSWNV
jgi:hypothetical protein